VHLQCHIGTDTVSLARLGAHMSGLDFSPASLAEARGLAERLGLEIDFHEADVYDAVDVLGAEAFDLVYTGIGAVGWLPSIDRWARTVARLLRPGGRLFMREGHPTLFTIDEKREDGLLVMRYPYFESEEPQVWDEPGTYVETDVELQHTLTHEWNHGLGELLTALLDAGLQITSFVEHDSVPWEALPGAMTLDDRGEWSLTEGRERLPLSYTVQAVRPG
jgi:SAM-dependent methyltransferase